jgi:hypothetical protein
VFCGKFKKTLQTLPLDNEKFLPINGDKKGRGDSLGHFLFIKKYIYIRGTAYLFQPPA